MRFSAATVALLVAATAHAEPSQQARNELARGIEQARAEQWRDALRTLDGVVAAEPAWSEAYFVRAGVLTFLAGDDALPAYLATVDATTDYATLDELLTRAIADLDRFLVLEPEAVQRDGVIAARDALSERVVTVRAHEAVFTTQRDATIDERPAPLALTDLGRELEAGLRYHLSLIDTEESGGPVNGFDLWTRVPIGRRVVVDAGLTGGFVDGYQTPGSLRVGATAVHDLGRGSRRARVGVHGTFAIALSDGGTYSNGRERVPYYVGRDQGARSPIRWAGAHGAELGIPARIGWGRGVVAAELAASVVMRDEEDEVSLRFVLGGSRPLARIAGRALGGQLTLVNAIADGTWVPEGASSVHEIIAGFTWWYGAVAVAFPLDAELIGDRPFALLTSLSASW